MPVPHSGKVVLLVGEGFEVGEGVLLDELFLVHVDAVGEAEVAGGQAAAMEEGGLGTNVGFFGVILRRAGNGAGGGVGGGLHFAGDAEGGVENPLVPLVG